MLRQPRLDGWQRLDIILRAREDSYLIYVYRVDQQGEPVKPYLLKTHPYPDLLAVLRDRHKGGRFRILVRNGRKLVLSGYFAIAKPLEKRPPQSSW